MSSVLCIQWTTKDGDVLASAEVAVAPELSAVPRISGEDLNELERIQNGAANQVAARFRMASRQHAEATIEAIRTPLSSTGIPAGTYEAPDWTSRVGQRVKCGRHGIRYQQDTRHAAWIRREAKKRGLKASVSLGDGTAHVRLWPAR